MNSLIDSLNVWGERLTDFALPMLWQSTLLIALVFAADLLLRRKVRAAVRYSLWFTVFVKLLLPPTLALPSGAAWWLRDRPAPVVVAHTRTISVDYREPVDTYVPPMVPLKPVEPPSPTLAREGWMLLLASAISGLLAMWVIFRWRQIARCVSQTTAANEEVAEILAQAHRLAGLRRNVTLRVTSEAMSPAVCGLFQPVILLPQALIKKLTASQLRAVLLHELIHLRRADVWVNCTQTLFQIVYWWHPLLWVANARMRRVREEAVDDAVMFALSAEAEVYAPTLLEVAKLAFARPLASLGLVGILESRSALRHRIERLVNFTTPRRAGVSVVSVICLAAFTALAVPMGEPPAQYAAATTMDTPGMEKLIPYRAKVDAEVFTRNLQSHATETMHTTNDDLNDILTATLKGFGLDCTGERVVHFERSAGTVTTRNTTEALGVLDEVIKELNLEGGERILNPPHTLTQILLEAQFFLIKSEDLKKLELERGRKHQESPFSPWWDLSTEELSNLRQRIKELGAQNISSPRILTANGITSELSVGDETNKIELTCLAYFRDEVGNVTLRARTGEMYSPNKNGWPNIGSQTNCAIFSRVAITNGGGALFRAEHGGSDTGEELILVLKAKKLEVARTGNQLPATENLPTAGRLSRGQTTGGSGGESTSSTTVTAAGSETNSIDFSPPQTSKPLSLVSQYISDGKSLFNLGKYDEAESKFNAALAINPDNQAALYYVNLIEHTRVRSQPVQTQAQNLKDPSPGTQAINVPGPDGALNPPTIQVFTSVERKKIYEKLKTITFDQISFSDQALGEVIRELTRMTSQRDPAQEGINFILNKTQPKSGSESASASATQTNDVDLSIVKVNLNGLKNVRLLDVLEAITKSADHSISYSILDYGIEFRLKGLDAPELHTRTFKVDLNTFLSALQKTSPFTYTKGGANSSQEIQAGLIKFFNSIGVDLKAPRSVFFNDRQGTLTVRTTDGDLEFIEQAVSTLNAPLPEVSVKVRFLETDPAIFSSVFTNYSAAGTNAYMGMLTEVELKHLLKSLEAKDPHVLLNEGQVTTLSGRQANFQVIDVATVVNKLNAFVTNNATHYNYEMTNMNFGTTLDVVPYVVADGHTIQLTVTPSITEFIGYENPKEYAKYDENLKHATLPLPKYRSRQMTTSATVWDGQTLVLGNLSDESVVRKPNGTNLRQPSANQKKNKRLIVLITPTIVDPSGNRVHVDGPNEPTPSANHVR